MLPFARFLSDFFVFPCMLLMTFGYLDLAVFWLLHLFSMDVSTLKPLKDCAASAGTPYNSKWQSLCKISR